MYTYSIVADVASNKINLDKLKVEIDSSVISTSLSSVSLNGDSLIVIFEATISGSNKTTLDGIILAHDGIEIPETIQESQKVLNMPFGSKTIIINGVEKKLYQRLKGTSKVVMMNSTTNIDFVIDIPTCKLLGIEIIGCKHLDICDIFVCDTETNLLSGLDPAVYGPNFPLNQFGFNVNVANDRFNHSGKYDADLIAGMVIRVVYKEQNGMTKTVGINFDLHEVK